MYRKWKNFECQKYRFKDDFDGVLGGNVGNWKKGDPCYKMAKNLVEECSSALQKVDLMGNEIGYLADKISKQDVEEVVLFLLTACSKMRKKEKMS